MSNRLGQLLCGVLFLVGTTAFAQPTPSGGGTKAPANNADHDSLAVEVLKDVHNKGAELYNRGDPAGCYRMYEGALVTIRPFINHRPTVIKILDEGLAEAQKSQEGAKVQAYRLHEVIELIRSELKKPAVEPTPKPIEPVVKPKDPTPTPKPVEPVKPKDPVPTPKPMDPVKPKDPVVPVPTPKPNDPVKPKDPVVPVPTPKPNDPVKPKDPVVPVPTPKPMDPVKPKDPVPTPKPNDPVIKPKDPVTPAKGSTISGRVVLDGKPLSGVDITLVALELPEARVYTGRTAADGAYKLTDTLLPGKYAVMVTAPEKGPMIPEKFQSVASSGLHVSIANGVNNFDLELKSK